MIALPSHSTYTSRKRAEEFQQKKLSSLYKNQASEGNIDTVFDTNLFLSAPPISQPEKSAQAYDTPVNTFTARDTRPHSEVGQTSDNGKLADNVNTTVFCLGFEDTETDKAGKLDASNTHTKTT